MLKKKNNPHAWTNEHIRVVKAPKRLAQAPPQLKIPGQGKHILQTDASDLYWVVILLEEDDKGTRHYCGHDNGQFKPAEQHYHSSYKEMIAVKRGIQKFEFHLLGHHFTVQMDNSFPRALDFKGKLVPNSQLLRLKDFEVNHIKGKTISLPICSHDLNRFR